MSAAILSIGTELTRGELVNTNCGWIAEQLTALGFDVDEAVTVDDDVGRIVEALRRLAGRHTAVVASGGLGPTTDDLTTVAVADCFHRPGTGAGCASSVLMASSSGAWRATR